jgi:TatD DNase family protein
MIYDSHAHLELFTKIELDELIKNSFENNVKLIVTQSTDLASCKKALKISALYPNLVKPALGYYPQDALSKEDKKIVNDSFLDLKKLILENKEKIIAIGEIGLDFCSGSKENSKQQIELFEKQLQLAEILNLPAIIHTRGAEKEILKVLKKFPKVKKVLHCYCANKELFEKAIKMNCYFTLPTAFAGKMKSTFEELLKIAPKNKILTETDAPFLTPAKYKGQKNQPSYIQETIKEIEKFWGISEEETEKIIEKNTLDVFNLK